MNLRSWMLWVAIALLTILPLWLASGPPAKPGAGEAPAFPGADQRAQEEIIAISPDYQPWFAPVLEPASDEIASLLFALQAAIGAGVIGFWLGMSMARERAARHVVAEPVPSIEEHRAD